MRALVVVAIATLCLTASAVADEAASFTPFAGFPRSLSLQGDRLALGRIDTQLPSVADQVRSYDWHAGWVLKTTLFAPPGGLSGFSGLRFGADVGAFIGARGNGGKVHVYARNGANWASHSVLQRPDLETGALFGEELEATGGHLAVTAPGASPQRTVIYELLAGVWTEKQELVAGQDTGISLHDVAVGPGRVIVSSRGSVRAFDL